MKMAETSPYRRLRRSLKKAVTEQSRKGGTNVNPCEAAGVAEKMPAPTIAAFFADPKARADLTVFDKIMKRGGGKPPRAGDEISTR
jgi:hypothetical protein